MVPLESRVCVQGRRCGDQAFPPSHLKPKAVKRASCELASTGHSMVAGNTDLGLQEVDISGHPKLITPFLSLQILNQRIM